MLPSDWNSDLMSDSITVVSQRIRLVAFDRTLAELQLTDRAAFFAALGVEPEPSWPPELVEAPAMQWTRDELTAHPDDKGWYSWAFISPIMNRLIGVGGFKGAPDARGQVEIDYSMLVSYREQGLATEAVNALLGWAYGHGNVKRVIARTRSDQGPPQRVLEKAGFRSISKQPDPDEGVEMMLWAHERAEAAA
jgi:[ribosomal protein S5]-alanine N-acetyltransferase